MIGLMKFAFLLALLLLTSYVGSPAHVPNFDNFTTPVIEPGKEGTFNFTIENRYVAEMKETTLNIGIYMWATEESSKPIEKIKEHPVIKESGNINYTLSLGTIPPGKTVAVRFHILTFSGTPDGVYFVRFSMHFVYNGTEYFMWSPGFFSKEAWDKATENHTLNLQYLSEVIGKPVDGIIPDSSFSVKSSLMWVLYVLIGITAVVGVASLYTYLHEGKEPNTMDEKIYRLKGKYRYLEDEIKRKMRKKNQ